MRPGARRPLTALEAERVPFAPVSASPRLVVDSVVGGSLARVPFAFTVSADDTGRTKPHPDPHREAAGRLGLAPGACVAVEDSPDGAASAEAAGCGAGSSSSPPCCPFRRHRGGPSRAPWRGSPPHRCGAARSRTEPPV
ncbi:HAD family hydrolase [Streptomyces subrutilus]|uniref:HAD family hydrolase n=1 Tax=Streptomyces subrutilus TaxID=36818 RepID=A0A1E5PMA3_9ACTN|nr:HAD family hydrolase [Streptomyces subrutilus]OEJ30665.1 hypothetical protein BGK67_04255 [Streptomyces subrutilus]